MSRVIHDFIAQYCIIKVAVSFVSTSIFDYLSRLERNSNSTFERRCLVEDNNVFLADTAFSSRLATLFLCRLAYIPFEFQLGSSAGSFIQCVAHEPSKVGNR